MKSQNLILNTKTGKSPCFSFSDLEKRVYNELTDLYINSDDTNVITFDYKIEAMKLSATTGRLIKIINKFMKKGIVRTERSPEHKSIRYSNYFILPNSLLDADLSTRSVIIMAYLYSIPQKNGKIKVTQKRIAERCNMDNKTVRKHIAVLCESGYIVKIDKDIRENSVKRFGTDSYTLKTLPKKGYFSVPRFVFNRYELEPKAFVMYLLHCQAEDNNSGIHWNSYNDMLKRASKVFSEKRSVIIKTIKKLIELKLIIKYRQRVKNCRGKSLNIDNMYSVIKYIRGTIRKKRNVLLTRQSKNVSNANISTNYPKYNSETRVCQDDFFINKRVGVKFPYNILPIIS